jgi:hypothetical protein
MVAAFRGSAPGLIMSAATSGSPGIELTFGCGQLGEVKLPPPPNLAFRIFGRPLENALLNIRALVVVVVVVVRVVNMVQLLEVIDIRHSGKRCCC